MTGILMRRERTQKQTGDGDWNHALINKLKKKKRQAVKTIDSSHQKLGERHETDSPSEPLEGTTLSYILTSDFWLPEL